MASPLPSDTKSSSDKSQKLKQHIVFNVCLLPQRGEGEKLGQASQRNRITETKAALIFFEKMAEYRAKPESDCEERILDSDYQAVGRV